MQKINNIRQHRQNRVRYKLTDNPSRPRLHVYRSSRYLYAQIIDDEHSKTLIAVCEKELTKGKQTKTEKARELGQLLAQKAKKANLTQVKFDRGSYQYHGRVRALADTAREGGLAF